MILHHEGLTAVASGILPTLAYIAFSVNAAIYYARRFIRRVRGK